MRPDGRSDDITYGWLRDTSNRLANALAAHGIARGDRVAILLPQSPEVAAAHIAVYKLGAVALPVANVFGVDALSYRFDNAGVKAVVTNAPGVAKVATVRANLPKLALVVSIDGAGDGALGFADLVARVGGFLAGRHNARRSRADDLHPRARPASPKGRCMAIGCCSAICPASSCRMISSRSRATASWTPADWAWAGGLLDACCRALPRRADGGAAVRRVRPRGGLRPDGEGRGAQRIHPANRAADDALGCLAARPRHALALRTSARAARSLGAETLEWGKATLGLVINEFYGQSECPTWWSRAAP